MDEDECLGPNAMCNYLLLQDAARTPEDRPMLPATLQRMDVLNYLEHVKRWSGLLLTALLLSACASQQYRAVPPQGATDRDIQRVDSYCRQYTDPEWCYRASGFDLQKVTQHARVEWRSTF